MRSTLHCVVASACAIATATVACASPGVPPGGPEDRVAPRLLSVTPDTNTLGARPKEVTFRFDEVVGETPGGSTSLERAVIISPSDGEPRVRWRRDAISIRPRRGFRPNTAYTVEILPGLADVRGNSSKERFATIFSTGSEIPATALRGVVFDWVAGRAAAKTLIQAFPRGDTTLAWTARADTAGRFVLRAFPAGSYLVRAFIDGNDNRALDEREAWDTVGVAVADSARVEMFAFVHDTIGPRINTLSVADSVTLRVEFDKPLDPRAPLTTRQFVLLASDSTPVFIVAVLSDSLIDAERAARDSARARADTTPRPVTRRDTTVTRVPLPRRRGVVTDTTPLPVATRPSPVSRLNLPLAAPLAPAASYRLRAIDVRGLLGYPRTSDRVFQSPRPQPKPDSTTARPMAPRATPPTRP